MEKYRIVEAKMPKQLINGAKIIYEYRYDIECQESLLFGLIKRWSKCGSFGELEHAKARIEFWRAKETWKVIDVD